MWTFSVKHQCKVNGKANKPALSSHAVRLVSVYTCKHTHVNVVSEESLGNAGAFLKRLHAVRHDLACCVRVAGRIPPLANAKLQKGIKALIIHYSNDYTSIRD